jgi:pyruvyl transferase EpsO
MSIAEVSGKPAAPDERTAWPGAAARAGLTDLKTRVQALGELLPADRPVLYLDYPMHLNVGDLMLQLAAERLFESAGVRIVGRGTVFNYRRWLRRRPDPRTVVVLHGGGNLGDVWRSHQDLREEVVAAFPQNRIVLLPQSIHFRDPAGLESCMRTWAAHPNLLLVLRDRPSYERAEAYFGARARLAPDLVHMLYGEPTFDALAYTPGQGTLCLRRQDAESLSGPGQAEGFDWRYLYRTSDLLEYGALRRLHRLEERLGVGLPLYPPWSRLARRLAARAAHYLAGFETVEADRLHGMLLATLLHRQVRWGESSTGKLQAYAETWLGGLPNVQPAGRGRPDPSA